MMGKAALETDVICYNVAIRAAGKGACGSVHWDCYDDVAWNPLQPLVLARILQPAVLAKMWKTYFRRTHCLFVWVPTSFPVMWPGATTQSSMLAKFWGGWLETKQRSGKLSTRRGIPAGVYGGGWEVNLVAGRGLVPSTAPRYPNREERRSWHHALNVLGMGGTAEADVISYSAAVCFRKGTCGTMHWCVLGVTDRVNLVAGRGLAPETAPWDPSGNMHWNFLAMMGKVAVEIDTITYSGTGIVDFKMRHSRHPTSVKIKKFRGVWVVGGSEWRWV